MGPGDELWHWEDCATPRAWAQEQGMELARGLGSFQVLSVFLAPPSSHQQANSQFLGRESCGELGTATAKLSFGLEYMSVLNGKIL